MTFAIRPGLVAGARPLSRWATTLNRSPMTASRSGRPDRPSGPRSAVWTSGHRSTMNCLPSSIGLSSYGKCFGSATRTSPVASIVTSPAVGATSKCTPSCPPARCPRCGAVRQGPGPERVREHLAQRRVLATGAIPGLRAALHHARPTGGRHPVGRQYMAYQCLDNETKERIENLRAVPDFTASFGLGMDADRLSDMRQQYPPAVHPVVRTHSRTGRRLLSVNEVFTTHIVGLEVGESTALLDHLSARLGYPSTSAASGGRPTPSPFGTTDARSTTPCPTTRHNAASWNGPPSSVIDRAELFPAAYEQEPVALLRRAS